MTRLRWYLGERHRILLWTLLIGGGGAFAIQRFQPQLATYAEQPMQVGVVVALWLLGVLLVRRQERKAWQRLLSNTPFETQNDQSARRPPLQRPLKRKTITVEPFSRGLFRQNGVRVQAFVDGVDQSLSVQLRYVGSGGQDEGIQTGNESLDSQFVFTVDSGSGLRELFDPDVQSALMEVSAPGTLRIEQTRVVYETTFTRLRPDELGALARAVATIASRMERLGKKGF